MCVLWLASCLPLICCQGSQAVLIRAELCLPFSPAEHLTTCVFSNTAAACHEARQTLCFQKLYFFFRCGWNQSKGWPAYAGGPLDTHTQIQNCINLFLGKEIASSRRKKVDGRRQHHGCESQNPEATSEAGWLWRRQAGRMCICSRKSSQLYACTSRKSIDLGWALGRSFFLMRVMKNWHRLARAGGCHIPGNIQGQVWQGFQTPDLTEDIPAFGRGVRLDDL